MEILLQTSEIARDRPSPYGEGDDFGMAGDRPPPYGEGDDFGMAGDRHAPYGEGGRFWLGEGQARALREPPNAIETWRSLLRGEIETRRSLLPRGLGIRGDINTETDL